MRQIIVLSLPPRWHALLMGKIWVSMLFLLLAITDLSTALMECQPRPYILNQLEIKSKLNRHSRRLRTYHEYYGATVGPDTQVSTCLMLHRCDRHSGCCANEYQECSPSLTSNVAVDITIRTRVSRQYEHPVQR